MSTECLIRDKSTQQAVLVLLDGNVTAVVPKLKEKYWQHGWDSIQSFVLAGKANHTVYESVSAVEFETDAERVDGLFPLYEYVVSEDGVTVLIESRPTMFVPWVGEQVRLLGE